ncbi:hypothetical protein OHA72_54440 [Dactylosporangium sp. NBC_01737]|uniref:hypothetical protein n=1 Tax=Dactylosporangium sp. NBC_01737 TaxID=2975959 RepID=UPI002E12AF5D|nr:hypothetical protein OHA72_54440 [Dactylosporangium sp. NBC_01737]
MPPPAPGDVGGDEDAAGRLDDGAVGRDHGPVEGDGQGGAERAGGEQQDAVAAEPGQHRLGEVAGGHLEVGGDQHGQPPVGHHRQHRHVAGEQTVIHPAGETSARRRHAQQPTAPV